MRLESGTPAPVATKISVASRAIPLSTHPYERAISGNHGRGRGDGLGRGGAPGRGVTVGRGVAVAVALAVAVGVAVGIGVALAVAVGVGVAVGVAVAVAVGVGVGVGLPSALRNTDPAKPEIQIAPEAGRTQTPVIPGSSATGKFCQLAPLLVVRYRTALELLLITPIE